METYINIIEILAIAGLIVEMTSIVVTVAILRKYETSDGPDYVVFQAAFIEALSCRGSYLKSLMNSPLSIGGWIISIIAILPSPLALILSAVVFLMEIARFKYVGHWAKMKNVI